MSFGRSVVVRAVVRSFLVVLLAFAQQDAIVHALHHDFERMHASPHDAALLDHAFCAECLALAPLGHANGATWTPPVLATYSPPRVARAAPILAPALFVRAYHSRAPPVFS